MLIDGTRMLHFRRITTQKRFIPQIDGLRFIAIASVVFFHIYAALENRSAVSVPWPENGDLAKRGVELFFAISGFILGLPFASAHLLKAAPVNLKQYFLRRLTRLEPPYFISLLVWAASGWFTMHRPFADAAPHLLASFVYLHNLIFGGFPGAVNSVAWSLEVEIQFYLLVPILAGLFAITKIRMRRVTIVALMLASGVLSLPLYRSLHFHYSIAYYLAFFLAGFLVCDIYVERKAERRSLLWDAVALSTWPLVWYLGRNVGHVVLPFVIVILYIAAFRGQVCATVLSHRVLTNIGGMCYSIYLFHFLVIFFVKHFTQPLHIGQNFWFYFMLQCCMILPVVSALCGAFFLLIERPCMDRDWPQKAWRWGQRLLARTGYRAKLDEAYEGGRGEGPNPLTPEPEQLGTHQ
jgi:peptidoglycan/LPS O-acetylase OafA/YrhL